MQKLFCNCEIEAAPHTRKSNDPRPCLNVVVRRSDTAATERDVVSDV